MQSKLLRVIQEKAIRAVGSEHEIPVDVRILSASHKDLAKLVEEERFRQDLFFRLNVIQLQVPRLQERPDDIPALARHFIRKYSQEWGMPEARLSESALQSLLAYDYPGNVRELENILQRAVTMAEDDEISASDLHLPGMEPLPGISGATVSTSNAVVPEPSIPLPETTITHTATAVILDEQDPVLPAEIRNLETYLENIERKAITNALEATRWNKTAAAEKLGISFRALRYRCKKLNID